MDPVLEKVSDYCFRIPKTGAMRVPGLVYASEEMMGSLKKEGALAQVANVACLPGIVRASMAMPDIHWGYGFPIGGVAAFDEAQGGIISPGGVGYDINCGVRLMTTGLSRQDVAPRLQALVNELFRAIPSGVGTTGYVKLRTRDVRKVLTHGSQWALEQGMGEAGDLDRTEEGGAMAGADPHIVSERAVERGLKQLGTLGSGNHFLEVGMVDEVFDPDAADAFGLFPGQVTVMIHSGSRGL
ncbi:MAG: RtcB family protein, partial [Proteobacteria bacterium]|nr:RtcB family protein [Pseudomonadota bacterium]